MLIIDTKYGSILRSFLNDPFLLLIVSSEIVKICFITVVSIGFCSLYNSYRFESVAKDLFIELNLKIITLVVQKMRY